MRVKKCRFGFVFALVLTLSIMSLMGTGFLLRAGAEGFSGELSGATGWGTTTIYVYWTDSDSSKLRTIPAKEPFLIMGSYSDDMLQIEYNGMVGYVKTDNVMINLPDVEPDIIYNLTNATGSVFTATTQSGTANLKLSLFGTQIYYNGDTSVYYDSSSYSSTASSRAGKVWNEKLGRYEFVVPVLFSAAEKIAAARGLAAADGYNLKIYDAYRPNVATKLMNSSLNSLYGQYGSSMQLGGYSTGFYVAAALSSHNIGCAIDVTMVRGTEEARMPTKMHVLSGDAVLLPSSCSSTTSSQLSDKSYSFYSDNFANSMTEEAKKLCQYMISAGMTGLGSEWWHYQDQKAYNANSSYYSNLAAWYPCQLYPSESAAEIPEVVTTRAEAVYQLWAAAGFPQASGEISFTDVTEYDYYYNAVRWAVSQGIISGSSSTSFSPNDAITRAGFLNLLYQYCGSLAEYASYTVTFEDVSPNAWYYDAVQWAVNQGIVDGTAAVLSPAGVLTQKQMHTFLTRAGKAGIALSENYI